MRASLILKQAPEAGGCAAGDEGDRSHRGKGDTGVTGSTVLRNEIKPNWVKLA